MVDIDISHIHGVTDTAADAISRLECRIAFFDSWESEYRKDPDFSAPFSDGLPTSFRHGRLWVMIASWFPAVKFVKSSPNTTVTFFMDIGVFEKRMTWLPGRSSSSV